MSTSDPVQLLSRALDQTGELIAKVDPAQAVRPTPCKSWDVRALIGHVVEETYRFASVSGGPPQPADMSLGDDWAGAYRKAADTLLKAWQRPGALEQTQTHPFGDVPGSWAVDQQITELTSHAWDIAKATGQSTDLDPELGQRALDWGRQNLRPEFRGDEADGFYIGAEVPVADDAPLYDLLAAFGGRDPAWGNHHEHGARAIVIPVSDVDRSREFSKDEMGLS
jgi:uncharacterized protein (TIGR03086 family)